MSRNSTRHAAARGRRLLRVALTMTLLGGMTALAAPVSGAIVWTEPRLLDSRGDDVTIATNGAGDSIAVWTRQGDSGVLPYASVRQGHGPWSKPQSTWRCTPDLACGSMALSQTATMDGSGRATVAWLAFDPGPNGAITGSPLYVAQRDPVTGWSTPRVLSWTALELPSLTTDASGAVTAVWEELEKAVADTEPTVELVRTAAKPAAGQWSSAELIDEGFNPSATQAPDGTLTVVYVRENSDPAKVEVVATSRKPGGTWPEAQSLSGSAPFTEITPDTVVDADGNVTAAWTVCTRDALGTRCEVQSASKQATGSWADTVTETVDEGPRDAVGLSAPRLAVDGDGAVTGVWGVVPDAWTAGAEVRAARRAASGGWETPLTVASTPVIGVPNVATDASGDVVATWSTRSSQDETVQAAYRPAEAAWQPPTTVDRQASDATWYRPPTHVVATGEDAFTIAFSGDGGVFTSDRVDDLTAPTVRVTKPARATLTTTKVRVAWSAADTEAGIAGVAVRRKAARYDAGFGDWTTWKQDTTAKAATFSGRPGRTYCFSAKATDRAGNSSRWSAARCTTTPVDDRTARATSGWRRVKDAKSYRGTETVTSTRGQRLVLPGASGRDLRLVATTCPSCGVVRVRLGQRDLGTVSLRSAKLRHKRVLDIATFKRVRTGRLVVRVSSSGKPVRIDGIAIGR